MKPLLEKQLLPIIEKIKTGNVALFIGAGCSISAGLPDSKNLIKSLKQFFSEANQELENFMDLCEDIEETPPYDSVQLHNFIKEKLDLFEVKESHKILTKYPWSAIFTTNFDNVIETAYNTSKERYKSCYSVVQESPSVNISDRSKIYLFKLMGTVDAHDSSSSMVLTRSDYHNSLIKRQQYLKLLADYVKSGTIIYIGYSFKDQIVKDMIKGLVKLHGLERLPFSYMLLKDEIPQDSKSQYFFSSHKILPIQGDFETFFKTLEENQVSSPSIEPMGKRPKATMNVLNNYISISEDACNMYKSSFEFLQGKAKCWHAFKNNWDFKRWVFNANDKQTNILKQINEELKEFDAGKNKILYVTGMPGCGKTVFTFRLAYDIYKENKVPVIIFEKNSSVDFKIVSSFIEDINKEYEKYLPLNEKIRPVKVILIFDDVSSNLKDVFRLNDFLSSRGRSALIIVNARQNELETTARLINIKIDQRRCFLVDETLNAEERNAIIPYLYENDFIASKSERWETIISRNYANSFFATFYSLVHPSRKPLDEIIRDQFNNLSFAGQQAFLNICCFSQFNSTINIELLVRSLQISYEDFYGILDDVKKIIFEEQDFNGNVVYRAHHRIIAQKTVEFFIPDKDNLFERYKTILTECLLPNNKEKEIVERLLIDNFSTKVKTGYFTSQQEKELFLAACQNSQTRSLKHHLALVELELEEYKYAENHLIEALELPRESEESYKGESDQNILTSLGNLNSILAIHSFRKKEYEKATEQFNVAQEYFNEAKHGDYPNVYAYHANANMWFQKAKSDSILVEKASSLSKCLEIIDLAKDNLNKNELQPILELETYLWTFIGDENSVKSFVDEISEKYNSANGFYIYAYYYFKKALFSETFKELYIDRALAILNEALSKHAQNEKCLALKCKILIETNKVDDDYLYDIIEDWKSVATKDDAFLLYNCARLAFILGYYERSNELFEELENGVGMGNKSRSKSIGIIIDRSTGNPKVFAGEVIDIFSRYDGNIKVSSLSSKLIIKFRPVTAKFNVYRGATVKFEIGFSYRGPIALNIIKH
jgi:hypothetical protein